MTYGIYPKGIIFDSHKAKPQGEFILRANFLTRTVYGTMRSLGAGLIGFFVIFFFFSTFPIIKEELLFRLQKKEIKIAQGTFGELLNTVAAEKIAATKKEAQDLNISSAFGIVIPKIGAKSDIIANVDAANEKEYTQTLKLGVAHAKGTSFPGQGKTIFLFAHSTDTPFNAAKYNAVFYLLDKLAKDDQIIVFFADKKYLYRVADKLIVSPQDTSWLTENDGEKLILQTCYPPGTSWERLLVIGKLI